MKCYFCKSAGTIGVILKSKRALWLCDNPTCIDKLPGYVADTPKDGVVCFTRNPVKLYQLMKPEPPVVVVEAPPRVPLKDVKRTKETVDLPSKDVIPLLNRATPILRKAAK